MLKLLSLPAATRLAAAVFAGAAAATSMTGCSALSGGPTCSDFTDATSDEQPKMAGDWADDNNMPDVLGSGGAQYLPAMGSYCSEDGHGGDHISDLELTY